MHPPMYVLTFKYNGFLHRLRNVRLFFKKYIPPNEWRYMFTTEYSHVSFLDALPVYGEAYRALE